LHKSKNKGRERYREEFCDVQGWEGRKGWEPVLSLHKQPRMRAMAPAGGNLRRRWAKIQGS